MRGGPWTAPPGARADLNPPSVTSEWAVVTGGSCGARPPSCSVVRVAPARQCGFAGAGPAAVALTASPVPPEGGVAPPALGGRRAAPVAPQLRWVRGGGGWGGRPPARSRACVGGVGGGSGGGPLVPWRCLLSAGGGGRHGSPGPGGQPSAGGSRPSPAPLYREPDSRAGPRWGPSSPGRCRAAPAGRGWP